MLAKILGLAFMLVIGYPTFVLAKYRGLRGASLGARIKNRLGEAVGSSSGAATSRVVVYALEGASSREVGLELFVNGGETNVMLTAMSREEAMNLVALLREAMNRPFVTRVDHP